MRVGGREPAAHRQGRLADHCPDQRVGAKAARADNGEAGGVHNEAKNEGAKTAFILRRPARLRPSLAWWQVRVN